MFAVPVELTPDFAHGEVTEVFPDRGYSAGGGGRTYDISPIDGRFLMRKAGVDDSVAGDSITVVLNWHQELLERVPVRAVQIRQVCPVGVSPTGVRARRPVAWIAVKRETD